MLCSCKFLRDIVDSEIGSLSVFHGHKLPGAVILTEHRPSSVISIIILVRVPNVQ